MSGELRHASPVSHVHEERAFTLFLLNRQMERAKELLGDPDL